MATFTLTIELGNEAMLTYDDIRTRVDIALRKASEFYYGDTEPMNRAGSHVRDSNGNTIGSWGVTE